MDSDINREAEDDTLDILSRVSSVMIELDLYLVYQDKSLFSLNKYPRIKELFFFIIPFFLQAGRQKDFLVWGRLY
jgi:hypothetical protein